MVNGSWRDHATIATLKDAAISLYGVVMSEHLLKILLTELKTVRVRCKNDQCGAVIELPVEKLTDRFRSTVCPVCRSLFVPPGSQAAAHGTNPFMNLAKAIELFVQLGSLVEIEFVLPAKE